MGIPTLWYSTALEGRARTVGREEGALDPLIMSEKKIVDVLNRDIKRRSKNTHNISRTFTNPISTGIISALMAKQFKVPMKGILEAGFVGALTPIVYREAYARSLLGRAHDGTNDSYDTADKQIKKIRKYLK